MKKWIGLLITVALCYFAVRPLLGPGYFPMHDDTQVARVVVMGKALREGQFPVRWVSDLGYGYGYPIFNFYGPLPYYFGGGLFAVGVDAVSATKAMFAVGVVAAAVFFYLFSVSIFDPIVATEGSVLFIYAPYHAVQIYVRGAVGEYWAIAFVPLVLWGVLASFKKGCSWFCVALGAIGLACVILSHTILGFVTAGSTVLGIIGYGLFLLISKRQNIDVLIRLICIFVIGLGLSAFFWLPAFAEMRGTGVSAMIQSASSGFFDNFVCINQLWDSPWGFGGSAPGCVDGMSFKLGKAQLVVELAGIFGWFIMRKKKKTALEAGFMGIGIVVFFLSSFAVLDISKILWSIVPFVTFIQYPWRLLTFTALAMGMCGGFLLTMLDKPIMKIIASLVVVAACLYMNAKLFRPQFLYTRDSAAFETLQDLRYRVSKISDEYLPPNIPKPQNSNDFIRTPIDSSATLAVTFTRQTDTEFVVNLDSKLSQSVTIKQAYFPGWIFSINGDIVKPVIARGLPSVLVLEGKSTLVARFTNTPVRSLGNIISLISVIVLGGIVFYGKKTVT